MDTSPKPLDNQSSYCVRTMKPVVEDNPVLASSASRTSPRRVMVRDLALIVGALSPIIIAIIDKL